MKIQRKFKFNFDQSLVKRIRIRFLEEYSVNRTYYDEHDARLIALDDYWIGRFLHAHQGNEDASYNNIIETLRFYHCNNLRSLQKSPSYFPEEFYKTGAFFIYEKDKENNLALHFRIKYLRRIKELRTTMEYFGAFMFYTVDRLADGSGWIFVVDFNDAKLANADLELCKYIIYLLKTHFPCGLSYILIIDLPWILRTFWSMVRAWIPSDKRDLLKMATRKDIHHYIDKKHLPDYLDGTCTLPYKGDKVVPKGCPGVYEFASKKLKLNEQVCNKILSIYEPILDELRC